MGGGAQHGGPYLLPAPGRALQTPVPDFPTPAATPEGPAWIQ